MREEGFSLRVRSLLKGTNEISKNKLGNRFFVKWRIFVCRLWKPLYVRVDVWVSGLRIGWERMEKSRVRKRK